jgi:hypothetical protein
MSRAVLLYLGMHWARVRVVGSVTLRRPSTGLVLGVVRVMLVLCV